MSIKPKYADKILSGEKTIEIRKQKPLHITTSDKILFYVTEPVKAILFYSNVKQIIETSPNELWNNYQNQLGITKKDFNSYFKNKSIACGIELEQIRIIKPFQLKEIKLWFQTINKLYDLDRQFYPPQNFCYASNSLYYEILLRYK
ncbi:MAG: ASCH domain-containing protein [Planctomycetaceae bacterium]|jgi:predicted transcriptional regulator|nr:ASCH domain-containing protein [Planctomycetaceae bacterium]